MRFLMIACLCVLMKAELPQAAKPYEEQGIKVEVSGELCCAMKNKVARAQNKPQKARKAV